MKKSIIKIIALTMLVTITSAYTGNYYVKADTIETKSSEEINKKEEVIYVNLNSSGSVNDIYVVNILQKGYVKDFGEYSEIKSLNSIGTLEYKDGTITRNDSNKVLYYQGILKNKEIPWNIDVRCFIDGIEYKAEEALGKSGKLEIKMSIKENKNLDNNFFEDYALQASFTFNRDNFKNIKADGATLANIGNDKQVTYTILPGKEKDISLTSDVTEFKMDSISINGVKLSLGIDKELFDISEVTDKVSEIKDAVITLDNGAKDLEDGSMSVNDGSNKLLEGINKVQDGLNTLNSNSSTLSSSSKEIKEAFSKIQGALNSVKLTSENLEDLVKASNSINEGINNLVLGLQTLDTGIDYYNKGLADNNIKINELVGQNAEAIGNLEINIQGLTTQYNALVSEGVENETTVALKSQIDSLTNIVALLQGNTAVIKGSNDLIAKIDESLDKDSGNLMVGVSTLNTKYKEFNNQIKLMVDSLNVLSQNMNELKNGIDFLAENYEKFDSGLNTYTSSISKLTEGYGEINNGAKDLTEGTLKLYDGSKKLTDGTSEFANKTSNIDTEIEEEIDSLIDGFEKKDSKVNSFVSKKNDSVESVQFVIKTKAIEPKEEEKEIIEEEENTTIIEKFLNLFRQD